MKKNMQKTIEEIKLEKKISKEEKNKIIKQVFLNILLAIFLIMYFILLTLGSNGTVKNVRTIDFNIFSILLLTISIVLFEIAYKKDRGTIAITGIEILGVAFATLFYSYILYELATKYVYSIYIVIAAYYIIKSICICIIGKRKYKKEKINDIKEVMEIDKPERRESIKRNNIVEIVEENNLKLDLQSKEVTKDVIKQPISVNASKKRGRPKKQETSLETQKDKKIKSEVKVKNKQEENKLKDIEQEKIKEEPVKTDIPKKRGRPKKQEIVKKETIVELENKKIPTQIKEKNKKATLNKEENVETQVVAKKRGRPKKQSTEIEVKSTKEIKPKVEKTEEIKEEPVKKKRGRPRKVN